MWRRKWKNNMKVMKMKNENNEILILIKKMNENRKIMKIIMKWNISKNKMKMKMKMKWKSIMNENMWMHQQ
jgi:hypothetical protein